MSGAPTRAPRRPSAFVLNLDAELELLALATGPRSGQRGGDGEGDGGDAGPRSEGHGSAGHGSAARWTAGPTLEGLVRRLRPAAAAALLLPGDVAVDGLLERGERLPAELAGMPGRAWCPTPSALGRLCAAGAAPEPAPPWEVLARANARRFSAELGQELPGARLCRTEEEVLETLAADPGRTFLAKRALSAAGRGRLPLAFARLVPGERAWIRAALAGGALQVEPRVAIELELAVHGELTAEGQLALGAPTVQEVGPGGAWRGSRPPRPGELDAGERAALHSEAGRVGRALSAIGYFGPFGVDAHRWRDESGRPHLCRRSEVNARYTMGWRLGMAGGDR